MSPETVQKHLLHQPFQAFRVYLSDGAVYEVRQPEMVLVMQREVIIALPRSGEQFPKHLVYCDLLHITRIDRCEHPLRLGEPAADLQPGARRRRYFNLNGHTYDGREHWTRLWKFYGRNVQSTYWTPFDIGGVVTGDIAVVWCHRKTRRQVDRQGAAAARHPLRQQRVHLALDHGVPQGGRAVARGARALLAGRLRAAARRRIGA